MPRRLSFPCKCYSSARDHPLASVKTRAAQAAATGGSHPASPIFLSVIVQPASLPLTIPQPQPASPRLHACDLGKAYALLRSPALLALNLCEGLGRAELWFGEGGREGGGSETKPPTWKLQWAECQGAGKGPMTLSLAYCRKMVGLSEQNTVRARSFLRWYIFFNLLIAFSAFLVQRLVRAWIFGQNSPFYMRLHPVLSSDFIFSIDTAQAVSVRVTNS